MHREEKGRQSCQREAAAAQPEARERRSRGFQELCEEGHYRSTPPS